MLFLRAKFYATEAKCCVPFRKNCAKVLRTKTLLAWLPTLMEFGDLHSCLEIWTAVWRFAQGNRGLGNILFSFFHGIFILSIYLSFNIAYLSIYLSRLYMYISIYPGDIYIHLGSLSIYPSRLHISLSIYIYIYKCINLFRLYICI